MESLDEVFASPVSDVGEHSAGARASVINGPPAYLQLIPAATYACDPPGRIRWFNRRASELWGRLPAHGENGDLFCGCVAAFDQDGTELDRTAFPMARALESGCPVRGAELLIERPDGSRLSVSVDIEPVVDSEGHLHGAIGCFHEVSRRPSMTGLRAAGAFRSEQEVHRLLDALPAAIYTTDAEGRITYFNQAAAALAGREPRIGEDHWCVTWRLYEPDGTPMAHDRCPMAIALRENRPVRGVEALAERPDGTRVPFLPYPTPLCDEAGNLVGAVNMLVDISTRIQSEGRQKALLDELNHRVKNNMQMLQSLLRTAQRETQSAEARGVLSGAGQRVAAMAAAQQLLYNVDSPASFSADAFLAAVCNTVQQSCGRRMRVAVEHESGEMANAMAMPLALILNELLVNAAKHGCDEQGEVDVTVGLTNSDGAFLLYVQDKGPGYDLATVSRRSGLKLIAGLVHQFHGKFEVTRTPGARCSIRFPARFSRVE